MNIALIVVGCIVALIVVGAVVFEIVGLMAERKARERFEKMTPDERRKEQERLYRARHFSDAKPQ